MIPIYLDYAASTPLDPRVAALMTECLTSPEAQANPASATHGLGLAVLDRIETARAEVAALIGARPAEIIFTSGATEANNLALFGVARAARRAHESEKGGARLTHHIVSARTEHKSVLDALKQLEKEGFAVTLVEPDQTGRVPPAVVESALRADTLLVSLMLANNEIGVINDVAAMAHRCAARGVLTHSDASQAVGKLPVDVAQLGVDFLSLTAHKFYGPKGVGALYVREAARPRIAPLHFGGGHERGLRPGTLATHQIVGTGRGQPVWCGPRVRVMPPTRVTWPCDWRANSNPCPGIRFNDRHAEGVPGLINASFEGVEGESLITGLPEIAVSTGSACSSATREPSYVLRALGRDPELAQSSLRLSLGRFTSAADVDAAATAIRVEVLRLRELAGSGATQASAAPHVDRESSLATGNTLLGRSLNPLARRYFLAAARPPQFPAGNAPPDIRQERRGAKWTAPLCCWS